MIEPSHDDWEPTGHVEHHHYVHLVDGSAERIRRNPLLRWLARIGLAASLVAWSALALVVVILVIGAVFYR